MNAELVKRVADAVLYEGYILYPYRPSTKNRQRWTFGGVFPEAWCSLHATGDRSTLGCQMIVSEGTAARCRVQLRFLQPMLRQVRRLTGAAWDGTATDGPLGEAVESVSVDGRMFYTWQEAVEREVESPLWHLADLAQAPQSVEFAFDAACDLEPLRDSASTAIAVLERRREPLAGRLDVRAERLGDGGMWRVSLAVHNTTHCAEPAAMSRDRAQMQSLASAHVIAQVEQGKLISLTDPPDEARELAAGCRHEGLWPVLVGETGSSDAALAAPIILYDYPQIAPESPGELCDGLEIDEILSLRVLTLSDDEKQAMATIDARTRAILERTEALDAAGLERLHGVLREKRELPEALPDDLLARQGGGAR